MSPGDESKGRCFWKTSTGGLVLDDDGESTLLCPPESAGIPSSGGRCHPSTEWGDSGTSYSEVPFFLRLYRQTPVVTLALDIHCTGTGPQTLCPTVLHWAV